MRICLDFGHTLQGGDTGAIGCGRKEQDCTREIGYKLKTKLEALGHQVKVVSVDSATSLSSSLATRVGNANNWGGDLYVSIHLNAGGGHGTEVFTYKGREMSYARNVLNNICNDFGYTNRGLKGASLYVTNHTNMPAFLIECCFIDSQSDMAKYDAEKFANAICKGITGTTSNATYSNPQSSQPQQSQDTRVKELQHLCNVIIGANIDEDNIWGNQTENAVRQLPLCGIPYTQRELTVWVQSRLGCTPDGIFLYETANAVGQWQANHGLVCDKIVGFNTYKSLALD